MIKNTPSTLVLIFFSFLTFVSIRSAGQTFEWSHQFSGPIDVEVQSTFVDNDGDVYSTGYFRGSVNFNPGEAGFTESSNSSSNDIFVSKHASDGSLLWVQAMGSVADDSGTGIFVDDEGNIVVTGYFRSTVDFNPGAGTASLSSNGSEDGFILKLDSDGGFVWAHNFGGAANEIPVAVATDDESNIYITGSFISSADFDPSPTEYLLESEGQQDIFLLKLDATADFLWAERYGGTQNDTPTAIDCQGTAVYVAGMFESTVDFNPGSGNGSISSLGSEDGFILGTDENGNFMWVNSVHDTGVCGIHSVNANNSGTISVIGDFNNTLNIEVSGQNETTESWGEQDAFIATINESGEWESMVRMGSTGSDAGINIQAQDNGDIYFVATFDSTITIPSGQADLYLTPSGGADAVVAKYNSSFELLWFRQISGEGIAGPVSLTVGPNDEVITSGGFQGEIAFENGSEMHLSEGSNNAFIQKFGDCGGNTYSQLDLDICHFYELPSGVAQFDESGIYIDVIPNSVGCDSVITIDLEIIEGPTAHLNKFSCESVESPSGNEVWTESGQYIDFVSSGTGCDTLYTVDLHIFEDPGACNHVNFEWVKGFEGASTVQSRDVVVDNDGNSYVCGHFTNNIDTDPNDDEPPHTSEGSNDIFIAKFDSEGKQLWTKFIGASSIDEAFSIALDFNNNVYVTGTFSDEVDFDPGFGVFEMTSGNGKAFVLRLDTNGEFIWAKQFGTPFSMFSTAIDVYANDAIYIAGHFGGTGDFDPGPGVTELSSVDGLDLFFMKLDLGGNLMWAQRRGNSYTHYAYGIAADNYGNVYATGSYHGSIDFNPGAAGGNLSSAGFFDNSDIYVYKFTSDGDYVWARDFGGEYTDRGQDITTDGEGNVFVTGYFSGSMTIETVFGDETLSHTTSSNDGFILKIYSAALVWWEEDQGFVWWADDFGTGSSNREGYGVAADAAGNVYYTGVSDGNITMTSRNPDGSFIDQYYLPSDGSEQGNAVTTDWQGNVYLTGFHRETTDFVDGSPVYELTALNNADGFLVKLQNCSDNSYELIEPEVCEELVYNDGENDLVWTSSGVYTHPEVDEDGCGHIKTIQLTVNNGPTRTDSVTVCNSFDSPSGNETWISSGTYVDYVSNPAGGCDSVVTINLEITSPPLDKHVFTCGEYTSPFSGTSYPPGNYMEYTEVGSSECDYGIYINVHENTPSTGNCESLEQEWIEYGRNVTGGFDGTSDIQASAFDNSGNIISVGYFRQQVAVETGTNGIVFNSNSGYREPLIVKHDQNGNVIWAKRYDNQGNNVISYLDVNVAKAVATDDVGNIMVAGNFKETIDVTPLGNPNILEAVSSSESNIFLCKYSPVGSLLWSGVIRGSGDAYVNDIKYDPNGNFVITGTFNGYIDFDPSSESFSLPTSGTSNTFIAKYNNSGELIWAKRLSGGANHGHALAISETSAIYIAGKYRNTVDFNPGTGEENLTPETNENVYVLRLFSNGNFSWVREAETESYSSVINGIALSPDGGLYCVGTFEGEYIDFNTSETFAWITAEGPRDAFIWKLNAGSGNSIWVHQVSGPELDSGNGVAVDENGDIYVVGTFTNTVDFNPDGEELILNGHPEHLNTFLTKMSTDGDFLDTKQLGGTSSGGDLYGADVIVHNDKVALSGTAFPSSNLSMGSTLLLEEDNSDIHFYVTQLSTCSFESYSTTEVSVCDSLVSPSGSFVWNTSGEYTDVIPNANGCDSIMTIDLTVLGFADTLSTDACNSYTWNHNSATYENSGFYTETYTNLDGCDSTYTLALTINETSYSEQEVTACDSLTSPSGNQVWYDSGSYLDTIPTVAGCDSILTINLSVTQSTTADLDTTACDSYTSPSGEHTWTSSGTYTDVIPNAVGCDSLLTINLEILNGFLDSEVVVACNSYIWDENNQTYEESGIYEEEFIALNGCDSVIQLDLEIVDIDTSLTLEGATLIANETDATYQWLDCENNLQPIEGETNQSFSPSENGIYAVDISVGDCSETSGCVSIVNVGLKNEILSDVFVYPNPTNGLINFRSTNLQVAVEAVVLNTLGQTISNFSIEKGVRDFQYTIEGRPGIYFIELWTSDGKKGTIKVVKM